MILSLLFPEPFSITLASFRMAFEQPVFPGKLIMWGLFMLSLVSWGVIVSKAFSLRRFRNSDIQFTKRLRRSHTTLEVFEDGWNDSDSLHYDIYLAGAKEAAFQLLGSREPRPAMDTQIKKAGKLTYRQIESLRSAFKRGLAGASARLEIGLPVLRIAALVAPLIGLTGMIWMLMRGFDAAKNFEEIAPWVSGSLCYLVVSMFVCIPGVVALLIFRASGNERKRELNDFTVEITRLFERSFAAPEYPVPTRPQLQQQPPQSGVQQQVPQQQEIFSAAPATAPPTTDPNHPAGNSDQLAQGIDDPEVSVPVGKKEYHSIRKAFESMSHKKSPKETPPPIPKKEVPINPIAEQATKLQRAMEGQAG